MIGRIQRVALRDVWRHEAYDFTTWLQENLDVLNEATGLELSDAEREQSVGSFSVDLVAQDRSGAAVIIENQLERSDHDHLGKLVTYMSSLDAQAAVWIVSEPRPEHVHAVSWLNDAKDVAFYLVKVEAVRIGSSEPAPLLTVIVEPSEASQAIGDTKRELAERHHERRAFWERFLGFAKEKSALHARLSPTYDAWLGTGAGRAGLAYTYVVNQHSSRVELYIDRGKDAGEENLAILDYRLERREEIEGSFGGPLDWQRLDGRRACRVRAEVLDAGYRDQDRMAELFEGLVDAMVRLERALAPHVSSLAL